MKNLHASSRGIEDSVDFGLQLFSLLQTLSLKGVHLKLPFLHCQLMICLGLFLLGKFFEGWQKGLFDCFEQVQELYLLLVKFRLKPVLTYIVLSVQLKAQTKFSSLDWE
jgi:hypothetical protein